MPFLHQFLTSCCTCNDTEGFSFHVGGVQGVMADGTVRFFSENIDARMWAATITRGAGEVISGDF